MPVWWDERTEEEIEYVLFVPELSVRDDDEPTQVLYGPDGEPLVVFIPERVPFGFQRPVPLLLEPTDGEVAADGDLCPLWMLDPSLEIELGPRPFIGLVEENDGSTQERLIHIRSRSA